LANYEAVCVDPAKVRLVWQRVSRLIYAAMKRGDISPFSAVEDAVLCGDAQLWIVRDGLEILAAAVTELQQTEWRKVCVIVACGGTDIAREGHQGVDGIAREDGRERPVALRGLGGERPGMHRWIGLIAKIEEFARAENCSATRIIGREGWARMLTAYRPKRVVLEKELH
jgi:hypothetical protein